MPIDTRHIWVNEFEATHSDSSLAANHDPEHGKVWDDFEDEVNATSEEAFAHFCENHPSQGLDYWDI